MLQLLHSLTLVIEAKDSAGCGYSYRLFRVSSYAIISVNIGPFISNKFQQLSLGNAQQLKIIEKMGCLNSQPQQPAPIPRIHRQQRQQKSSQKKPNRLLTNYTINDIRQISDQERKAGVKPVYSCPICFLRFNRILACDECSNCICHKCYLTYEKKSRRNFMCSFCKSETSIFRDYEQQAHSYFDTTGNNGFLSKEQRNKIDQETKNMKAQNSILQPIQQGVEAG